MKFDFSYLDIAFKNGSVITVNDTDEIAEAVGIKGNKIVLWLHVKTQVLNQEKISQS